MARVPERSRVTTVQALRERQAAFVTPHSIALALSFRPRESDVIISPYPKSGTTWLQQIVHGLRTRGSMQFDEITAVVPWLELAHDLGLDIEAEQIASPRAYKSHLSWYDVPKGGRYICAFRDPKDVVISMYRFFEGWLFEPGSISMTSFARDYFMLREGGRRYWTHLVSWWSQRHRPEVLLLSYELMHEDLNATIRRVAAFIGCELDDELLALTARQSTLEFMRAHRAQFDDHLVREARDEALGLPPGSGGGKVRSGRVGDYARELSAEVAAALDVIWRDEVEPETGLASYDGLRDAMRA